MTTIVLILAIALVLDCILSFSAFRGIASHLNELWGELSRVRRDTHDRFMKDLEHHRWHLAEMKQSIEATDNYFREVHGMEKDENGRWIKVKKK